MKRLEMLVVAQKKRVLLPYEVLLGQSVDRVKSFDFDTFLQSEKIDSDIVLIDLEDKKYLRLLDKEAVGRLQNARIILISPFSITQVQHSFSHIARLELVLSKPVSTQKLLSHIQSSIYLSKKNSLLERKNKMLVKLVELFPANIAIYSQNGVIYYANGNFLDAHALSIDAIDKKRYEDITSCNIEFDTILQKLQSTEYFTLQRQEGIQWFESTFYKAGRFVIHYGKEITDQKNKELRLEQAAVLFENSSEGIIITDERGVVLSVNPAFSKITGYTPQEAIGQTPAILQSNKQDERFYENMWDSLIHNGFWQGEVYNKRKNGELYPQWLSISKTEYPKYKEASYIAIFSDISAIKEHDAKLHFYANHDTLTGLANRVSLQSEIELTIKDSKRKKQKFALLFIDLDKFKEVNDTFGHTLGDQMLKTVAKRIENATKKRDFLSRVGGDEFVLIAKDIKSSADVVKLAQKIKKIIDEPIVLEDNIFFMTLSVGIAIFPDHGNSSELLTKHADAAMYAVKEDTRDGYMIYDSSMTKKVSHKLNIQNELKTSIDEGRFEIYYQAVLDLQSSSYIGAEALVRWNHPQRGILAPAEFIDFVEDSPMCAKFGLMVVQKVAQDIKQLQNYLPKDFALSINISSDHFFKEYFERTLLHICQNADVDPRNIELELLETHIMQDKQRASQKIERLKAHGFKTAIDDFGTGYSSLSYLKNFNVDKLKIDKSFIRDFLADNNDKDIVDAIIKLSKIFKLTVQAEGVESKQHHTLLQKMECDLAQGYYYNKPLPLDAFIALLKEGYREV
ncbi:MAG: putative bifunctional diguanylate cyclase/phosphodiesterase [Campylobacterota bacterium]